VRRSQISGQPARTEETVRPSDGSTMSRASTGDQITALVATTTSAARRHLDLQAAVRSTLILRLTHLGSFGGAMWSMPSLALQQT
jgi:hypothetical protein